MQRTTRLQNVIRPLRADGLVVVRRRHASSRATPPPKQRTTPPPKKPATLTTTTARARPSPIPPTPLPGPSSPSPPPRPPRSRAVPWVLSSLFAGGIAFDSAQQWIAARQPCANPAVASLAGQTDVSGRYDFTADGFDSEVGLSEMLMGINRLRRRLARQCRGHVLEVSCGTGRNLGYYDLGPEGKVESLTFVDLSAQMVEVCRRKWEVLVGERAREKMRKGLVVRFLPGSAVESMPLPPRREAEGEGEGRYDTIIQTMGLCSTPTPVELLVNTVKYLDMDKEDSRILLLEHGRSYRGWLNNILDNSAQKHAEIHGCWFNRDIGALVAEAAEKTGLEIVKERRHHFGTTWMFELKPKAVVLEKVDTTATEKPSDNISGSSWFRWK